MFVLRVFLEKDFQVVALPRQPDVSRHEVLVKTRKTGQDTQSEGREEIEL